MNSGTYQVVLHFAELYFGNAGPGGAGSRQFHVDMEGQRKLTNYDIFAQAGGALKAVTQTFTVSVSDGTLNINFLNGAADNAKISAIEVISSSGAKIAAAGSGEEVSELNSSLHPTQSVISLRWILAFRRLPLRELLLLIWAASGGCGILIR